MTRHLLPAVSVLVLGVALAVGLADAASVVAQSGGLGGLGETLRSIAGVLDQIVQLLGVLAQVLRNVGDTLVSGF
jgi:hypothetical protein